MMLNPPDDGWFTYTTNSSMLPVNFTSAQTSTTVSWAYYQPPIDPSAPAAGVREPRRPLPPSWSGSNALELPEGCP
jgi:hypothetical protein